MPDADLPWGRCHYRSDGAGPVLLLLHSSSQTSQVYAPLLGALSGYRMIAPDMPGFGASDPLPAGASMEEIAAHLVHFLDRLGIAKAHVFGLHSGNKVAAALAANWPARVERVVLAGMTHSLVIDQAARNRAMLGYVANKDAGMKDDQSAGNSIGNSVGNSVQDSSVPTSPQSAAPPPQGVAGTYRANLDFDFAAALERIAAPVLLIELVVRNEDHLGRQAALLAQRMQACTPIAVEGDDKALLRDPPVELARLLGEFLG